MIALPSDFFDNNNLELPTSRKETITKSLYEFWRNWECETRQLYAACVEYSVNNQIPDSAMFIELLEDVDCEIEKLDRKMIELQDMKYDFPTILTCQKDIHDKYKGKIK